MKEYDFNKIESKWQAIWEKEQYYRTNLDKSDTKMYCLVMFPYPSGEKLHIGHWYNFGPTDTWARFKKLQGYNVFEPIGYDAFGLPAENYAIKKGVHPAQSTAENIAYFRKQLKAIGAMYDWDKEINTSSIEYYRWTQWLFLQLYHKGLAYRKKAPVNWCPQCKTVLANEQAEGGTCERCGSDVFKKDLEQWFFKITDYAERLLEGHDRINWPEKTILMQKNWIGRSEGTQIRFDIADFDEHIEVFTTRPDTLFGVTYMTFAPEHPLVKRITTPDQMAQVKTYIAETQKASDIDRTSTEREKTGVFTGAFAINPVNDEKVPIWISDYVLLSYGTGAVMAVPAHDQRDFEFAQKFDLPIREVISKDGHPRVELMTDAYVDPGIMINSAQFNGLDSVVGKEKVTDWLISMERGSRTVNYKLRDWLISRQRYWGAPIPIIYCETCGEVPVPEEQLPVELPRDVKFTGTGESPLTTNPDFVNTTCPKCGGPGRREVDTMDTFVCSSWYFLRYPNPRYAKGPFDPKIIKKWLPVDQYVGGAEHATMHLLYARFFTKVLYDLKLIDFDEPFTRLVHQGIITHEGEKMSKTRGNVVNPDQFIEKYGADCFRMYMMFMGSYTDGGDWNDEGINGLYRFINRFWRLIQQLNEIETNGAEQKLCKELNRVQHYSIKMTTIDLERFHFNTCISRIMELVNATYLYIQDVPAEQQNKKVLEDIKINLIKLMAPFAPHTCEELWEQTGHSGTIFDSSWPQHDENMLVAETATIAIQINGKLRSEIQAPVDAEKEPVMEIAMAEPKVKKYTQGKTIFKVIHVKNKLVNLVVR
ncbi:leucine--tRNA ligase [candidate division KSB1 bacterium]|nr:leucine--tRNA ligase [candidate division KSB1 bacterium]